MGKARVELGLDTRGGTSLQAISRDLRRMDNAKLTGIFKKALESAAAPYPARVRASALAIPVKENGKHTGLRARIALCASLASWTTGREAGVSVWIDPRKMEPDYKSLPLYMEGVTWERTKHRHDYSKWRHPVFGTSSAGTFKGKWVTQASHPYFRRPVEPLGKEAEAALKAALADVTRQLDG